MRQYILPSELFRSHEPSFTGHERHIRAEYDRLQQTDVGHTGRERVDIAQILTVSSSDLDVSDLNFRHFAKATQSWPLLFPLADVRQ